MGRDYSKADWYLQAWAKEKGKRQSDLVAALGWHKNAAHRLWHGKQPYRRDLLNQVAEWLELEPFELLMPPKEALAIRGVRENAAAIVAGSPPEDAAASPARAARRVGTVG